MIVNLQRILIKLLYTSCRDSFLQFIKIQDLGNSFLCSLFIVLKGPNNKQFNNALASLQ